MVKTNAPITDYPSHKEIMADVKHQEDKFKKSEFGKLKSCALTANYNQYLILLYWKRKYKYYPKFLIPKKVIELRERLKSNIETLNTWGCHA